MLHTATQWRGGDERLKIIVLLRRSKREKTGGKGEVELHLSFMLSGDFLRPVDERSSRAQRKRRADTNDVSGK